jgi:hypothetical protein
LRPWFRFSARNGCSHVQDTHPTNTATHESLEPSRLLPSLAASSHLSGYLSLCGQPPLPNSGLLQPFLLLSFYCIELSPWRDWAGLVTLVVIGTYLLAHIIHILHTTKHTTHCMARRGHGWNLAIIMWLGNYSGTATCRLGRRLPINTMGDHTQSTPAYGT